MANGDTPDEAPGGNYSMVEAPDDADGGDSGGGSNSGDASTSDADNGGSSGGGDGDGPSGERDYSGATPETADEVGSDTASRSPDDSGRRDYSEADESTQDEFGRQPSDDTDGRTDYGDASRGNRGEFGGAEPPGDVRPRTPRPTEGDVDATTGVEFDRTSTSELTEAQARNIINRSEEMAEPGDSIAIGPSRSGGSVAYVGRDAAEATERAFDRQSGRPEMFRSSPTGPEVEQVEQQGVQGEDVGVEGGEGEVSQRARELEREALAENEQLDRRDQVRVVEEDGRLQVEPTTEGDEAIQQSQRIAVAGQLREEDVDVQSRDVQVRDGEARVDPDADIPGWQVREAAEDSTEATRRREQGVPTGQYFESDVESVEGQTTDVEQQQREQLRQQMEEEGVDDYEIERRDGELVAVYEQPTREESMVEGALGAIDDAVSVPVEYVEDATNVDVPGEGAVIRTYEPPNIDSLGGQVSGLIEDNTNFDIPDQEGAAEGALSAYRDAATAVRGNPDRIPEFAGQETQAPGSDGLPSGADALPIEDERAIDPEDQGTVVQTYDIDAPSEAEVVQPVSSAASSAVVGTIDWATTPMGDERRTGIGPVDDYLDRMDRRERELAEEGSPFVDAPEEQEYLIDRPIDALGVVPGPLGATRGASAGVRGVQGLNLGRGAAGIGGLTGGAAAVSELDVPEQDRTARSELEVTGGGVGQNELEVSEQDIVEVPVDATDQQDTFGGSELEVTDGQTNEIGVAETSIVDQPSTPAEDVGPELPQPDQPTIEDNQPTEFPQNREFPTGGSAVVGYGSAGAISEAQERAEQAQESAVTSDTGVNWNSTQRSLGLGEAGAGVFGTTQSITGSSVSTGTTTQVPTNTTVEVPDVAEPATTTSTFFDTNRTQESNAFPTEVGNQFRRRRRLRLPGFDTDEDPFEDNGEFTVGSEIFDTGVVQTLDELDNDPYS